MLHIQDKLGSRLTGCLLDEFTCGGCGREVQRKELTIPFGPRKGEIIVADLGCKCENIRLAKQAVVQANEMKMRRLERVFGQQSLLNEALRRATFESYAAPTQELQQVKERLVNYAENFDVNKSENLLLYGDYGVGKSHLSAAITKVLVEKGHSALFLSLPKLLTQIKNAFGERSNFSEAKLFQVIGEVELFVLDDLGAEYMNPKQEGDSWVQTKLFEVLDARAGKPTIFTTNLNGKGLELRLSDRNLSRMLERTEIIHMRGPDYRRRGFS